jgi:NAD(P)-dependent dehydrogenase (short-subunit alcohol dehydrogenase family)
MTKILAAELAPYNIRVIGYVPGVTKTPLTEEYIQTKGDMLLKPIPLRRFGTPEDVANAVLFAASDKASYITGAFIEMAGGKYCVQDPTVPWDVA